MKRFALIALFALISSTALAQIAAPPPKFRPGGGPAAGVRYETIDGAEQSLNPYLGQTALVVNFWATWCPPCVKEMPSLDKLSTALKGTNIKVIAIAVQTETAEVTGFFKRAKLQNLTPYMDRQMIAGRAIGMRGLPTTVLINSEGQIIGRVEGDIDWAEPSTVAWIKGIQ